MAVAVKNSSETASPGLLDRFAVATLAGVLYVYVAIAAVFYGLPALVWNVLGVTRTAGTFAIVFLLVAAAFVAVAAFGIRTLAATHREGLKASIFVAFFWILAALAIGSAVGAALENGGQPASVGTPIASGLVVILLVLLGRFLASPGFEQKMIAFEHQGWFSTTAFKRGQGQRVRRGTMLGILIVAGCGIYTLLAHNTLAGTPAWELPLPYAPTAEVVRPGDAKFLPGDLALDVGSRIPREKMEQLNEDLKDRWVKIVDQGSSSFKVGQLVERSEYDPVETKLRNTEGATLPVKATPATADWLSYPRLTVLPHVMFTLPIVLAAGAFWFAYRLVNYPVFADFLIATEAEMNKVSWTTRKNLVQDTVVVLVTVVLLTTFLYVVDMAWAVVLTKIGVLQVPTQTKTDEKQEVPW